MPIIQPSLLAQGYERERLRLMHQGRTHGVAAANSGYSYVAASHGTLADVAGSECTTGTLPGYARRTFTPTFLDDGTTATVAIPSQIDVATVPSGQQGTSTGVWIYVDGASDAARFIVTFWPANPGGVITLSNQTFRIEPDVFARAP